MRNTVLVFGLFFSAAALSAAASACSSTSTPAAADVSEGGTGEGGKPADGGKDTSTAADTSTPTDPDDKCAAEAKQTECGQCCAMNHMAGYKVFQDSLLGCTCDGTGADGGTGPCATDCAATICAATPSNPDQTCSTCLQNAINTGGACQETVSAACSASPDCVAQQTCIKPCATKPL